MKTEDSAQYQYLPSPRRVFALADLHLSLGNPSKDMGLISSGWKNYVERLQEAWDQLVGPEDCVLIPGDVSWAMKTADAKIDLDWIDQRAGTKVISVGNHDYWWPSSYNKARAFALQSTYISDKGVIALGDAYLVVSIKGTDDPMLDFHDEIQWSQKSSRKEESLEEKTLVAKRLVKENERLARALGRLRACDPEKKKTWIVMIHYPPTDPQRAQTQIFKQLSEFAVDCVVFGHLHSLKESFLGYDFESKGLLAVRGEHNHCLDSNGDTLQSALEPKRPILHFVAADWLNFVPKQIY